MKTRTGPFVSGLSGSQRSWIGHNKTSIYLWLLLSSGSVDSILLELSVRRLVGTRKTHGHLS
jgi:hypothetical protein